MLLPLRCKNPPESFPFATVGLIVANVLVYLVTTKNGLAIRPEVVDRWAQKGSDFGLLRGTTALFLHGDPAHLLGNMWFLALFGFAVEGRLRWVRFLPLYFLAGGVGDLLDFLVQGRLHPEVAGFGASGAIMGVMGAALWMFPYGKVTMFWRGLHWGWEGWFMWEIVDWPLWTVALYFVGFDLLWSLIGLHDGIGHLAHLGGAVAGVLVCMAFRPCRDSESVSDSKAFLAETKDLATLNVRELADLHRVNPDDPTIILHWMHKGLLDPRGASPECVEAFLKALPRMRREMDPRPLAGPVLALADRIGPRELVALAGDLERAADGHDALRLYETAYGLPGATDAEQETACYRSGLLYENAVLDPARAAACYEEVLARWPMGPFADPARTRLAGLRARTKV